MMEKRTVYLVENSCNDKAYVGQTKRKLSIRLRDHRYHAKKQANKSHFHKAIRCYGADKFSIKELGIYNTREKANKAEKLWIILLDSNNPEHGYNGTSGGDYGWSATADTIEKLRQSHLGHKGPLKGQKRPDWVVEKMRGPRPNQRGPATYNYRHDITVDIIRKLHLETGSYRRVADKLNTHLSLIHSRLKEAA